MEISEYEVSILQIYNYQVLNNCVLSKFNYNFLIEIFLKFYIFIKTTDISSRS